MNFRRREKLFLPGEKRFKRGFARIHRAIFPQADKAKFLRHVVYRATGKPFYIRAEADVSRYLETEI